MPRWETSGVPTGGGFPGRTLLASPVNPNVPRMEQVIQSFVSGHHFMGCVLVARGDGPILNKGYGFANLEWSIPNSPSTKFRLGSITKRFTAASILLFEERGKLRVYDPVKKYMPDAPRRLGQNHVVQSADAHLGHTEFYELSRVRIA